MAAEKGPVTSVFNRKIQCDEKFFGSAMQNAGELLLKTVETKACELGNVNFSFFTCDVMLGLLRPSLCMYCCSPAGQRKARQAVVRHFIPYLFSTQRPTTRNLQYGSLSSCILHLRTRWKSYTMMEAHARTYQVKTSSRNWRMTKLWRLPG